MSDNIYLLADDVFVLRDIFRSVASVQEWNNVCSSMVLALLNGDDTIPVDNEVVEKVILSSEYEGFDLPTKQRDSIGSIRLYKYERNPHCLSR